MTTPGGLTELLGQDQEILHQLDRLLVSIIILHLLASTTYRKVVTIIITLHRNYCTLCPQRIRRQVTDLLERELKQPSLLLHLLG